MTSFFKSDSKKKAVAEEKGNCRVAQEVLEKGVSSVVDVDVEALSHDDNVALAVEENEKGGAIAKEKNKTLVLDAIVAFENTPKKRTGRKNPPRSVKKPPKTPGTASRVSERIRNRQNTKNNE